jgi:guanylate kinase
VKLKNKIGQIFIISGPSGSGKTSLLEQVLKEKPLKGKIKKSVSFTTRPKRSRERQGRDYFFITEKQFENYLRSKKVLESTRYLGYDYGTPRDFLQRQLIAGKHLALCLDLKGALRIRRAYPANSTLIFILPPSLSELRRRIQTRCKKTTHIETRNRLKLARREISAAAKYDYCLLNRNLGRTAEKLKEIILSRINSPPKKPSGLIKKG